MKLLRQALREKPDAHDAMNHLANLLKDKGEFVQAAELYRRSIAIMPGYAPAHNNLGLLHLAQERFREAAACFTRAVETEPGFANAWFHLAESVAGPTADLQAFRRALAAL